MTGNRREEEIEVKSDSAVADLLDALAVKYGAPFRKAVYEPKAIDVKSNYIVSVNGYLLNQLKGLETKLKAGDRIVLLPIVSGG